MHSYDTGNVTLHHADLYRLEQLAEVTDLGLGELAEYHGIVLVEWGDVAESTFGEHLLVRLDLVDAELDARKGEVFYAMYRQVPGGLQQEVAPQVGPVDDLVPDLLARSQEALCVGDGALRYRSEILEGFHCEISDDAHPSAGPLVQLAHARALREEWVSPSDIRPVYLRQPDAQINWATRASAAEDPGVPS